MKHHDGCFHADPAPWPSSTGAARCCSATSANPNGSVDAIACVTSREGNVAGLMPHPEHAVDPLLGSADGRVLLAGLLGLSRTPAAA